MEFNEKLQELRKQKGLTQEELAKRLYVSRTAISKWESGRGYPNIESLRAIAKYFSVSVDELLSSDEILSLAEDAEAQKEKNFRDKIYGLLDICTSLLIFLPFFADRSVGTVRSVSLLGLNGVQPYLKIPYFVLIVGIIIIGILTLVLQGCDAKFWIKSNVKLSLSISSLTVMLFILSLQPYAAIFIFALLIIKALMLVKA